MHRNKIVCSVLVAWLFNVFGSSANQIEPVAPGLKPAPHFPVNNGGEELQRENSMTLTCYFCDYSEINSEISGHVDCLVSRAPRTCLNSAYFFLLILF